jgi:hypothetical protein
MKLILLILGLLISVLSLSRKQSSFLKVREDDEADFDDHKLQEYEHEIDKELDDEDNVNTHEREMEELNNEADIDQKELEDELHKSQTQQVAHEDSDDE